MCASFRALRLEGKASLYANTMRDLRETARANGVRVTTRMRKREVVAALRAAPQVRSARSRTASQLREARTMIRHLNGETVSPNMLGALRGSLQDMRRLAPDAATRRQADRAERMTGAHLFADLDAWRAREQLFRNATARDRRLRPRA